jgi:dihydrofolate reductase
MKLALIAAVARNGVIGADGDLPWRLPDDLRHFKRTTLDHCLILGRKTFDSLPGALPGRTLIVLSRTLNEDEAKDAVVVRDLDAALAAAASRDDPEPRVAGGAEIYALALPRATRLWLTRVDADVEGDVFFPAWDESGESWERVRCEPHERDERHAHAFAIEEWVRR